MQLNILFYCGGGEVYYNLTRHLFHYGKSSIFIENHQLNSRTHSDVGVFNVQFFRQFNYQFDVQDKNLTIQLSIQCSMIHNSRDSIINSIFNVNKSNNSIINSIFKRKKIVIQLSIQLFR